MPNAMNATQASLVRSMLANGAIIVYPFVSLSVETKSAYIGARKVFFLRVAALAICRTSAYTSVSQESKLR